LIGYLEWWDLANAPHKQNSKSNHHASVVVVEPSTSFDTLKEASSFITTSGNIDNIFYTFDLVSNSKWIIDSSTTNHITFDSNHIQSMKSSNQHIMSKANGTTSPVVGKGSISLTKNLNLNFVLIVPLLNHNLLFVA
jgi:hypothetical protein